MSDIVERLAKENERRRDAGGDMLYRGPSDPLLTEAADAITDLRAEVERLRRTLGTINAVIGNADHSKGHGPNAAELRGNMLNDIRDFTRAALTQTKDTTDDA